MHERRCAPGHRAPGMPSRKPCLIRCPTGAARRAHAGARLAAAATTTAATAAGIADAPRGRPVLHAKLLSNIQEVRARGARTIVIAEDGDTAVRPYAHHLIEVPRTPTLLSPLVTTVPLQVLAAEIAQARGYDVDKPRNLAKSVTVE